MKPEDDCCFDWKKAIKEFEDNKIESYCPHCDYDRCPTCGRRLWPTPHGNEPCHPIPYTPYPWQTYPPRWWGEPRWEVTKDSYTIC